MDNSKISNLQPLFCSRAALVKAENKMNDYPEMDCQLVLQFNDGTFSPLLLQRDDIATLLSARIADVEKQIETALDATND